MSAVADEPEIENADPDWAEPHAEGASVVSTPPVISPHEAAVVCHAYALPGGYAASEFVSLLIAAMAMADGANLDRLGLGFPGLAAAVRLARSDEVAVARLVRIAKRPRDTSESGGFRCPRCDRVSWNPYDLANGYCGACQDYTAPAAPPGRER